MHESLRDLVKYPSRVTSSVEAVILSEVDGVVSKIFTQLGQKVGKSQVLIEVIQTDPIYQFRPFRVTAPVSGAVGSLDVSVGSRITRGQKLALVMDTGRVRAHIEIVSDHVGSLQVGTTGKFIYNKQGDTASVRVTGISPMVDQAMGTASAELEFVSSKSNPPWLRPGVIGQVEFEINQRKGLRIKEEALRYDGDQVYVRIVENGVVAKRLVKVASKEAGFAEITSGLEDGVFVVERSSGVLKDGQPVTVQ